MLLFLGETFASTHVLLGQSEDISQAEECGVPPSVDIDSPFYYYTCAEPRVMASHVFVRKLTQYEDQLIVCELTVYTVNGKSRNRGSFKMPFRV